jgi:hypothetical protein
VNFLDLVRASEKDIGSGQRIARRYFEVLAASAAAVTPTFTGSVCGADNVRVIHTVTFASTAGAAQTNLYAQLFLQDSVSGFVLAQLGLQFDLAPVAAGVNIKTLSALEFVQMQGEQLVVSGTYSGGAAVNAMTAYVMGWEFPRGSLQR